MEKEKLTIEQINPYLHHKPIIQYKGLINVKDIVEWEKEQANIGFFGKYTRPRPNEVIGIKYGYIKKVEYWNSGIKYLIGKKSLGLKSYYDTNEFKLCLYPLSMLTKEIEVNGEIILPIVELAKIEDPTFYRALKILNGDTYSKIKYIDNDGLIYWFYYHYITKSFSMTDDDNNCIEMLHTYKLYQWLYKHHFAINIPEHLYIDKTTI